MKKNKWLKYTNTAEEYIEPDYYDRLLKKYSFTNKSDLQIFFEWLASTKKQNILELGSGSGRASEIVFKKRKGSKLYMVDLSGRMIKFTKNKFRKNLNTKYTISDSIEFLQNTQDTFDTVFSLWSFSHSTHQHLHKKGLNKGSIYIKKVLNKFIKENLEIGGKFFLIHFDSMSEEQQILMKQWKKIFPIFKDSGLHQSPSKIIIDKTLLPLDQKNKIRLSIEHIEGDSIKYESLDKLLEIFLNFHLESFFNKTRQIDGIIKEIKKLVKKHRQKDGTYEIKPSCYIYTFTKINNI